MGVHRPLSWLVTLALTGPLHGAAQQVVGLPSGDRMVEVAQEPRFRVGAIAGEPWEVYGSVDGVAFDGAGNLFVLDAQNSRIVVLDDDGGHLRTFGGQGGGPGEFQMPRAMTVTDDDRVVVYDMARRSYSILDTEGEPERSVPTDVMSLAARPNGVLRPYPGGGFVSEYRGFDLDTGDPATSSENGDVLPVRWYASDESGEAREIFRAAYHGPAATMVSRPGEQQMRMGGAPAFSPIFRWAPLPHEGAAYVDGVAYEVRVVDGDGTESRVLTRDFEPRPVTARDREDEKARRLEALETTGAGAPMRVENVNGVVSTTRDTEMGRRMIDQLTFADEMPVVADLAVDLEGRIWVQRTGDRVGQAGPVDVMRADGSYLGTVRMDELPDVFGPDGLAAWVEVGELGVMGVRVARLRLGSD